jgi:hypothetical protein
MYKDEGNFAGGGKPPINPRKEEENLPWVRWSVLIPIILLVVAFFIGMSQLEHQAGIPAPLYFKLN